MPSVLRTLQTPPNPQAAFARHLRAADAANRRRDWPRAEARYAAALALDPPRADLWEQYGHALKEQKRPAEAAAAYERAARLAPEQAGIHEHLGYLRLGEGRRAEALAAFERVAALDPGRPGLAERLGECGAGPPGPAAPPPPFRDIDDRPVRDALLVAPPRVRPRWAGPLRHLPSRLSLKGPREAVVFLHLHKTGGLTLDEVLARGFAPARRCPVKDDHLHLYTPAELDGFDFFSGHFDWGALRLLRRRVRTLSMFRKPRARLISFYRFHAGHDLGGRHGVNDFAQMANAMTAEEFFEDERVRRAPEVFNHYLTAFSLGYDQVRAASAVGVDRVPPALLDRAIARVRGLDAIGILERFDDSAALACAALGIAPPRRIRTVNATDKLAARMKGAAVPPVVSSPRLDAALADLLRFDEPIYDAAVAEFEHRCKSMHKGGVGS